jgi:hypothetical protein
MDKAKGRAKEAVGSLTGNKDKKAEGRADQNKGAAKDGTSETGLGSAWPATGGQHRALRGLRYAPRPASPPQGEGDPHRVVPERRWSGRPRAKRRPRSASG